MIIYLASSFDQINRIRELIGSLFLRGHTASVVWWNKDFKTAFGDMDDEEWYRNPTPVEVCSRNFKGIREADMLVLIAPEYESKKFNGANIEVGYALGLEKKVMSWGKLERSAMYIPVERYEKIDKLLEAIDRWQEEIDSGGKGRL